MTTTTRTIRSASERQVNFLRDLLTARQPEQLCLLDALIADGRLNARMASKKIDYLKTLPEIAQTVSRPATDRQASFVVDLLEERVHTLNADAELENLTFHRAREIIELLKTARKVGRASTHGLRAGYYATETGTPSQSKIEFRRVDTKGQVWIISGGNQLPCPENDPILPKIAEDPRFAAATYGQVIGRCGRCHTRLTDKESRDHGFGPVCVGRDW
jgi:hypothetical protein